MQQLHLSLTHGSSSELFFIFLFLQSWTSPPPRQFESRLQKWDTRLSVTPVMEPGRGSGSSGNLLLADAQISGRSYQVWRSEWRRPVRRRCLLLVSCRSCCCRVMEALYVLNTLAVRSGIRELRCLFRRAVWEEQTGSRSNTHIHTQLSGNHYTLSHQVAVWSHTSGGKQTRFRKLWSVGFRIISDAEIFHVSF